MTRRHVELTEREASLVLSEAAVMVATDSYGELGCPVCTIVGARRCGSGAAFWPAYPGPGLAFDVDAMAAHVKVKP